MLFRQFKQKKRVFLRPQRRVSRSRSCFRWMSSGCGSLRSRSALRTPPPGSRGPLWVPVRSSPPGCWCAVPRRVWKGSGGSYGTPRRRGLRGQPGRRERRTARRSGAGTAAAELRCSTESRRCAGRARSGCASASCAALAGSAQAAGRMGAAGGRPARPRRSPTRTEGSPGPGTRSPPTTWPRRRPGGRSPTCARTDVRLRGEPDPLVPGEVLQEDARSRPDSGWTAAPRWPRPDPPRNPAGWAPAPGACVWGRSSLGPPAEACWPWGWTAGWWSRRGLQSAGSGPRNQAAVSEDSRL